MAITGVAADLSGAVRQQDLAKPITAPKSIKNSGGQWQIVSVNRVPASSARVKLREQLRFEVKLKKTGTNKALPIRLKVTPAKPKPDYRGSTDGIKANIDAGENQIVSKTLLVAYRDIYKFSTAGYGFDITLTKPNGKTFVDLSPGDNTSKVRLLREKDPAKPKVKKQAKKKNVEPEKPKSSGVVRRSGVAGKTADRAINFKVNQPRAILESLRFRSNCVLQGKFERLIGMTEGEAIKLENSLPSPNWCSKNEQYKADKPTIVANRVAQHAIFGVRVCTDGSDLWDASLYALEFWYKGIRDRALDDNNLIKQRQWAWGSRCEWRPWQYCPKDSKGQRMVAVGYEAHIKHDETGDWDDTMHGIRLVCRPLSDVYID